MSKEVSAIAVDFGSTNSGCCRVCSHDADGNLVYSNPEFLQNIGSSAKDNTWFYIEPSFLERVCNSYDALEDADFRIESRVFPNRDNPNVIWGRESIKRFSSKIASEGWVGFKRFKMMLYHGNENYASLDYPLILVIKTFLRIIRIECLELESRRLERQVTTDDILWGVTIPSIWSDENKQVMREIVHNVFNDKARILSEPEGPLVYSLIASNAQSQLNYKDGRTSFVIDCGGGTTDMCLMKEALQSDGSYRIEMIANSDGSAAGGNDIDEAFYTFILREICKGKTTDSGISYDSLNDQQLMEMLFDGFQARVGEFITFEDNWYSLKNREDLNSLDYFPFSFTAEYRKWLIEKGHKEVADVVRDYLVDGYSIQKDKLVDSVFSPTFKKIGQKIKDILVENKGVRIDRIVFAGGMSCNYQLKSYLRELIKQEMGYTNDDIFSNMGALMSGGSIAAGTCYLLLYKTIVQLAKKNYYYCSFVKDVTGDLKESYARFGIMLKVGEINAMIDDEKEFAISLPDRGHLILTPVALKNKLVSNYVNDTLSSNENSRTVRVRLFSSDDDYIIYANTDNPKLKTEAEIEVECEPGTRYRLEMDVNEAQIANDLHYVFSEYDSGLIVSEGIIENVVKEQ